MSEGGSMTIQVETIKTWMVRYYKGEERAVLFDDHLAALAEKEAKIEEYEGYMQQAGEDFEKELIIRTHLEQQIAALQDEINNPKKTYCAWCGFTVEIDDDAGSGIAKHVDTCEKHPLNRKIAALTARIKELEGALEKIIHEIGVPQPGYIQPVANAYEIAQAALKEAGDEPNPT